MKAKGGILLVILYFLTACEVFSPVATPSIQATKTNTPIPATATSTVTPWPTVTPLPKSTPVSQIDMDKLQTIQTYNLDQLVMLNRIGTDANETLFFPASDRFAVLTNHSTIEIWGIFTLSIENTLEIEYETKTFRSRFTISPNENIFFWHTGEPNFKYWIFNDNEPYLDIILNTTKRRTIQFSASGKYLSMEHSEGLQIWHTPKQNPLDLLGYSDGIWKIIFNPDETLILAKAGAHDRQGYHLWSTVTGEEIPIPPLFQADFNPNNNYIFGHASVYRSDFKIWDPVNQKSILLRDDINFGISDIKFPNDGSFFLTSKIGDGYCENIISFRNTDRVDTVFELLLEHCPRSFQFNHNQKLLLITFYDGNVELWGIPK